MRVRQVKCDERPNGGCANCERLRIPCLRPEGGSSSGSVSVTGAAAGDAIVAAEKLRRHRAFRSCRACRIAKVRCSGQQPECERCRQRSRPCEYDDKAAPRWVNRARKLQPSSDDDLRDQQGAAALSGAGVVHGAHGGPGSSTSDSDDMRQSRGGPQTRRVSAAARGQASPEMDRVARSSAVRGVSKELEWLFSPTLPTFPFVLRLVKLYFKMVHPLRSFGFIHRPSFMQFIEDQSETARNSNIVLLAVCALGAKFFAVSSASPREMGEGLALRAGCQWARKAQQLLFASINRPSTDTVMAAVLLHEHEIRIGNYAAAFMITGLAVRLAQGLQLNVEQQVARARAISNRILPSLYESCRRVMWSVYVMDSWVGSGVDELTMLDDKNINIQLPAPESDFVLETPRATELPQLPSNASFRTRTDNLDLEAHFVLMVGLRKRILSSMATARVVKHLDESQPPWVEHSEYATLRAECQAWYSSLPESLKFSRSAVQKRKVSGQHGALMLLHITYHQSMCDLTRIGMAELFRIRAPIIFPDEQHDFVRQVQDACFDHCMAVSSVLQEALHHGTEAFADTWLCVVAHDVSRVQIHYAKDRLGSSARHDHYGFGSEVNVALSVNFEALHRMIPLLALAKPLHAAALALAKSAGFDVPSADAEARLQASGDPAEANCEADETYNGDHQPPPIPTPSMAEPSTLAGPAQGADSTEPSVDIIRNMPLQEPFQLPMSFDDLQVYMSLPPLLDSYEEPGGHRTGTGAFFDFNGASAMAPFQAAPVPFVGPTDPGAGLPEYLTQFDQRGSMWAT
ncbi:hydrolase or acyltransferase of alpha beta superfamily [Purpureocillium lavendulum]|uniref:Hydrolase or acyltransferase of alpha beta superfamily n=1 Tax=Purpureocillium lavendulum TaxID=1247861 RepID=A0AB34FIC3_9HYPO|nr:hydrolase or acyltransferase of alpha beta superfamily [Purpureocillium lavendulum]